MDIIDTTLILAYILVYICTYMVFRYHYSKIHKKPMDKPKSITPVVDPVVNPVTPPVPTVPSVPTHYELLFTSPRESGVSDATSGSMKEHPTLLTYNDVHIKVLKDVDDYSKRLWPTRAYRHLTRLIHRFDRPDLALEGSLFAGPVGVDGSLLTLPLFDYSLENGLIVPYKHDTMHLRLENKTKTEFIDIDVNEMKTGDPKVTLSLSDNKPITFKCSEKTTTPKMPILNFVFNANWVVISLNSTEIKKLARNGTSHKNMFNYLRSKYTNKTYQLLYLLYSSH